MRKRVYIETSIPSFYFEVRGAPEMAARREWTRAWQETTCLCPRWLRRTNFWRKRDETG